MIHGRVWNPALDGVRGICVLMIVAFHIMMVPGHMPTGWQAGLAWRLPQGLTAFFCLSGFLLYRPYARAALDLRDKPELTDFWRRRVLRIFPTYVVVLVLATVVLPFGVVDERVGRLTPDVFAMNLLLVQGWFPQYHATGIQPAWTLVVDLTFYAFLPILGWLALRSAARFGPLVGLLIPVVPLLIGGLTISPWVWSRVPHSGSAAGTWSNVVAHSFLGQMGLVAAGMAAAVLASVEARRVATALVGVGAVALVVADLGLPGNTWVALGIGGGLVLLTLDGSVGEIGRVILSWRPLTWMGEQSYALYLWHTPVMFAFVRWMPDVRAWGLVEIAGILVVSIAFARVTTRFIGEPAIRLADRLSRRSTAATR